MKRKLLVSLISLLICLMSSCNDDEGYVKIKMESSFKCHEVTKKIKKVKYKRGTVFIYKLCEDCMYFAEMHTLYLKDEGGGYYKICSLPKEYSINGLEIIFSGNVYEPYGGPLFESNPMQGVDFEITDLWVKMQ